MHLIRQHAGALGLAVILLIQGVVAPTIAKLDAERYARRQTDAMLQANKRLFTKFQPAEAFGLPIGSPAVTSPAPL